MYISDANNVVIEITRRCNMCCAHCLRGDAENVDIQEKYINAFLDSFPVGDTSVQLSLPVAKFL